MKGVGVSLDDARIGVREIGSDVEIHQF